ARPRARHQSLDHRGSRRAVVGSEQSRSGCDDLLHGAIRRERNLMMKYANTIAMDKSAPTSSAMLRAISSVFLVDDDASVRRALARLIKSAGHNVQTFASAREFLGAKPVSQE